MIHPNTVTPLHRLPRNAERPGFSLPASSETSLGIVPSCFTECMLGTPPNTTLMAFNCIDSLIGLETREPLSDRDKLGQHARTGVASTIP